MPPTINTGHNYEMQPGLTDLSIGHGLSAPIVRTSVKFPTCRHELFDVLFVEAKKIFFEQRRQEEGTFPGNQ